MKKLAKVLEMLTDFANRTGIYIQPVEIMTVDSFLSGFRAGHYAVSDNVFPQGIYEQAALSRGWKWRASGIVWHMRKKKLDDEAVIRELIAVEMEAYRLAAETEE